MLWKDEGRCETTVGGNSSTVSQTGSSRGAQEPAEESRIGHVWPNPYRRRLYHGRATLVVVRWPHQADEIRPTVVVIDVRRCPAAHPWPGTATTPAETARNSRRGRGIWHGRRQAMSRPFRLSFFWLLCSRSSSAACRNASVHYAMYRAWPADKVHQYCTLTFDTRKICLLYTSDAADE